MNVLLLALLTLSSVLHAESADRGNIDPAIRGNWVAVAQSVTHGGSYDQIQPTVVLSAAAFGVVLPNRTMLQVSRVIVTDSTTGSTSNLMLFANSKSRIAMTNSGTPGLFVMQVFDESGNENSRYLVRVVQ